MSHFHANNNSNSSLNGLKATPVTLATFDPEPTDAQAIGSFEGEIVGDAIDIIKRQIPAKIIQLRELVKTKNGYLGPLESFRASLTQEIETGQTGSMRTKRGKASNDGSELSPSMVPFEPMDVSSSPAFRFYLEEYEVVKTELFALSRLSGKIKLWIQLNVPRIEDGNNFGVGVQNDMIGQLGRAEDNAFSAADALSQYFPHRAKLIAKMLKHRSIASDEDAVLYGYRIAIADYDIRRIEGMSIAWTDLLHNYMIIYDLLMKNMDKIISPRSTNISNMY